MSDIRAGLKGKLPTGDGNGLQSIASDAAKDPKRIRVAVVLFDCEKLEENFDTGQNVARLRIRRAEPITDAVDAAVLQRILMREFERRTGQTVLPMDLESDVDAAFEGLDIGAVEREERERAEGHVEHEGADESWAQQLHAMREGQQPAVCRYCDADITWDEAFDGWVTREGLPGDGEHFHEPKGQAL